MNKKQYKHQATCVQCGKQFDFVVDDFKKVVFVCSNHECPNYGLLAICQEKMPKN